MLAVRIVRPFPCVFGRTPHRNFSQISASNGREPLQSSPRSPAGACAWDGQEKTFKDFLAVDINRIRIWQLVPRYIFILFSIPFIRISCICPEQETVNHVKCCVYNWPGVKVTAYNCHNQECTFLTRQKAEEEIEQGEGTQGWIREMEENKKKSTKYI
jgi:hypothetical protein